MHFLSISSLAVIVIAPENLPSPSIAPNSVPRLILEFRVSVLCFTTEGSAAENIEGPESWKVAELDEAVRQRNSILEVLNILPTVLLSQIIRFLLKCLKILSVRLIGS
ncbi:hypothetical protein Csa_008631 [Cucumis sativus]|uniref:Uncharacterized protein n=1 Tax=Cucumis sativus TaxID=3659 RepID=A0A0A0KWM8_CUCSA|nr:hypothetical protein Csa_008631 [Cucumis sativus]